MRLWLIERRWKRTDGAEWEMDWLDRNRIYEDEEQARREALLLTQIGDHFEFRCVAYELVRVGP